MKLDPHDARVRLAIPHLLNVGQWLKVRTRDGQQAFGIPSQSTEGLYHIVTPFTCDCKWGQRREGVPCSHKLAARIHMTHLAAVRSGQEAEHAVEIVA